MVEMIKEIAFIMRRFFLMMLSGVTALSFMPFSVSAQVNIYAPRVVVNDWAVTEFEYQQRLMFLQLLNAPGDPERQAIEGLIDDRLRLQEAKRFKVAANEAEIKQGMEEFAKRANMPADQFIKVLGDNGVYPETFRDFVNAGLVWREIAAGRFRDATKVSDIEVDRALEAETRKIVMNVALSELIIPIQPGQEKEAMEFAKKLKDTLHGEADFAAAVEQYSAAPSRNNRGRIDVMPLTNLPPNIAGMVKALRPMEVSSPVLIPNAIAMFQLRAISEGRPADAAPVEIEYARFQPAAGPQGDEQIAHILAKADNCKDIYGLFPNLTAAQYRVEKGSAGAIPAHDALALARLDAGETAIVGQGGTRALLMLCARRPLAEKPIDRNNVRARLQLQKIERQSEAYLAKLRADAMIRWP